MKTFSATAAKIRIIVNFGFLSVTNIMRRRFDPRKTLIPPKLLGTIQEAMLENYRWRGLPFHKNPFDIAIYLKILQDLKPKVIIEIGSASGGSAKFFADQTKLLELGSSVYSLDINPVVGLNEKNLRFFEGDILRLEDSPVPKILKDAKRPLLVVEDGPHTFEGCLAALNFFHMHLEPGDMIVVEDGNLRDFGIRYLGLNDGPNRAVKEFLKFHSNQYTVRTDLCDFYGQNATWNTDGYLERTA